MQDLYQDIILDHYKHPRGRGLADQFAGEAHHVNPTCGDEITVRVAIDDTDHVHVSYEGQGCSISQASASVMFEQIDNLSEVDAHEIREAFLELMHSKGQGQPDEDVLGDAVAFTGVSQYPARIKCALLPWMAFEDALSQAKAGG